ncbi:MAG: PilN domain-containing protein [Syntrophales bacterium]|jgi:type IV pilus assembly protein PilN|nr:PilN domain-containing protein [Syntrophales bacterium]MDY0045231.1 PilN domain-containing protein [Syntrophales bacterium]
MIKINLIPYHEEMKKIQARRQLVIGAGAVIFLLLALASVHLFMTMSVKALHTKVEAATSELERLKAITGNLDKFKTDKALVEKKLSIINNLEGDRKESIHLLTELSKSIPAGKMWLTLFSKKERKISLEGMAVNNDAIASFMDRLEESPFIKSVDLVTSRQTYYADKIELKQFMLLCEINAR